MHASSDKSGQVPQDRWLTTFRKKLPWLFYALVALVAAEIIAVFVAPLIIPDHVYLSAYLPDESIAIADKFMAGEDRLLIPDDAAGWRNRPNVSVELWETDSLGSRSTHDFGLEKQRETRVLFLGSSEINGSMDVSVDQTIPAGIEDSLIEALNFGTMLYAPDQMLLDYRNRLSNLGADVIVVGLCLSDIEALTSMYVPFRRRLETNVPFLKPRHELAGGNLKLIPLPSIEIRQSYLDSSDMIGFLSKYDSYYDEFDLYRRLGILPISRLIRFGYTKVRNLYRLMTRDANHEDLLFATMDAFVAESEKHGARVVFLMLPQYSSAFPGGWRQWLPDHYGNLVEELATRGYDMQDARTILRGCGVSPDSLYMSDFLHFTPRGNEVIADGLRNKLEEFLPMTVTPESATMP